MNKQITRHTPASAQAFAPNESSTAVMEPSAVIETTPKVASPRKLRTIPSTAPIKRFAAMPLDEHATNRQAELFYLQKQIQLQTQMVFILEDGARVQGVIEWYDRNSIKVRGKLRMLIYKSAIKYLYKAGEVGSAPED